jgi:hypothetical protein
MELHVTVYSSTGTGALSWRQASLQGGDTDMLKQKLRILQMEMEILKVASVASRFYQTPYVLLDSVYLLCFA